MSLLMQHAIEGMYSNPEYGGNAGARRLEGHRASPATTSRGATPTAEVTHSDGPDPLDLTPPDRGRARTDRVDAPPAT